MRAFRTRIKRALADPILQEALRANAERRLVGRSKALKNLSFADQVRSEARVIRQASIQNLEVLLEQFTAQLKANGVVVHRAYDAIQAQSILVEIATAHQAKIIAKSKSMVSEEIGMNHALELMGFRVVETDLGEFIVQLRGEQPSHIVTPALHLKREQVAQTFADQLGMAYSIDVSDLNQAAHHSLREVFLAAEIGVSGVNFGVAESGTLCLLTNEGNGRMVTTLPRVHVALMGIERVVPRLVDLSPMLQLLPRSATGQILTSYVALLHGPRQAGDLEGPEERHVILVDNGRTSLLQGPLEEALLCIRCGACLNACPVFQGIGGHAYESTYPGPIGSVISPGFWGVNTYGQLAKASTLCGVCREVCPVDIDLPRMLLEVRQETQQRQASAGLLTIFIQLFTWAMSSSRRYSLTRQIASLASRFLPHKNGWIRWAPTPIAAWTKTRDLPPFITHDKLTIKPIAETLPPLPSRLPVQPTPVPVSDGSSQMLISSWIHRCREIDGDVILCKEDDLPEQLLEVLRTEDAQAVLLSPELAQVQPTLISCLNEAGIDLIHPAVPENVSPEQRKAVLHAFDEITVGITSTSAALAESGSILVSSAVVRANLASLLPRVHIAILREQDIYPDYATWIVENQKDAAERTTVIITGPSRTSDIEMTLSIGVHGPAQLIVFLLTETYDLA